MKENTGRTVDLNRSVVGEDRCPACGTSVPAVIIGPNVVDMPYDFFSVSDTRDFLDSDLPRNYRAIVLALCAEIERVNGIAKDSLNAECCESCKRVYDAEEMEYEPEDGIWLCKPCADEFRTAEAAQAISDQENLWLKS